MGRRAPASALQLSAQVSHRHLEGLSALEVQPHPRVSVSADGCTPVTSSPVCNHPGPGLGLEQLTWNGHLLLASVPALQASLLSSQPGTLA